MKIFDYLVESTMVEFKISLEETKPKSWLKSVSAFANTKGGTIVFGVRDSDHEIVGLTDANYTASKISELINARIQPTPRYELTPVGENGITCLILKVGDGPAVPYYYVSCGNRIAFIRTGDESVEAPIHELNALILKGQNRTFDELPSPFKAVDVSFTLLEATFKNETQENMNRERDLISFGLVNDDGYLTFAGALFCDQGLLRQSKIFCTRWKGTGKGSVGEDALDDKEYSGSIISLLENAETFINNNSKTRWSVRGMRREEESDYPQRAVREVLVNAIMHRDYQIIGSEIHIDMYDDRLDVSSPGGMMDGRKIQDMDLKSIPSMRRNQIISDLFNRLHFMDRRGSGISRIMNAYADCKEKPKFFSETSQFLVSLPNKSTVSVQDSIVSEGDSIVSEGDSIVPEGDSIVSEGDSIVSEKNRLTSEKKTLPSENKKQVEFEVRIDTLLHDSTLDKTRTNTIKMFMKFGYNYSFNREKICEVFNVQKPRASQIINLLIENKIIEKKQRDEYFFIKP